MKEPKILVLTMDGTDIDTVYLCIELEVLTDHELKFYPVSVTTDDDRELGQAKLLFFGSLDTGYVVRALKDMMENGELEDYHMLRKIIGGLLFFRLRVESFLFCGVFVSDFFSLGVSDLGEFFWF